MDVKAVEGDRVCQDPQIEQRKTYTMSVNPHSIFGRTTKN